MLNNSATADVQVELLTPISETSSADTATISKARTFRNILYTSATKGATVVCQLLASFVVARNLSPSDYGVVGFAFIIINFLSRFGDLGIGSAVICRPRIDQRSLWTAFTLKLFLSIGAFIIAVAVAPFAHHFFEHPATTWVIRLLALNFLIGTIGFLPQQTLIREIKYKSLVAPGVVSAAVRASLIILLILRGWKYWAIIVADLSANLAGCIVIQAIKWVPIRLRFDWEDAKEYLRFGIPLFGSGVLVFIIFNLDNFLVGTAMGSRQLGYYALAFTWASFVSGLLADTVNNVLVPTLSTIKHDAKAIRRWFLKAIDMVAFVAVIGNTSLLVNAHWFLGYLGKGTGKWGPAETPLKILCAYGIVRAMTETLGSTLLARGRTKLLWHSSVLVASVEVVLLLLVLRAGRLDLVAVAVLIAYVSQLILYVPYLRDHMLIRVENIVSQLWPALPAIAAGYFATLLLPASFGNSFSTLAMRGAFTAVVVALIYGLFSRFRAFHEARGMISPNFEPTVAQ